MQFHLIRPSIDFIDYLGLSISKLAKNCMFGIRIKPENKDHNNLEYSKVREIQKSKH
jgi:hypothetical protein